MSEPRQSSVERECEICGRKGTRGFTVTPIQPLPGGGVVGPYTVCVNVKPCLNRKSADQHRRGYYGMHDGAAHPNA